MFEEKLYDWVWITGSTLLGCAFTNEVRQGWAAAFCSSSCLGLPYLWCWDTYSLRSSDTLAPECSQELDNARSTFNKPWQVLIQEGEMVALVPKIWPEGETQMISDEWSSSRARKLHRKTGNGFGCPCQAMVECGSLKKISAVLPPPAGARCLARKRHKPQGGWGCTREGHESRDRRVAFQLVASSACWASGGVVGMGSPVPAVGGLLLSMYTQKNAWVLLGTGLVTPCSQRNVFIPVVLSVNFPSPSGHLFYSIMAWGLEVGEKGRIFWRHTSACCQLCWWEQTLNLSSVSICKCLHGLSSQAVQSVLLSVCIKCLQCFIATCLLGVNNPGYH